ncbi:MAG: UDP-N-acetylmuramoyl-L-alanyl-D-glutamate--2,6-diaminopimelate ligase [Pseudomonadota bacterium]|jgi:UDP-N-acetylmuramoyl-L-alanyl-D-glutamate--2,6-diaminopimelate ligase
MQSLHSPTQAAQWLRQHVKGVLCTDSRTVKAGDAFIAWPGAATDGRAYVQSALAQGAAACLVEAQGSEVWTSDWLKSDGAQLATYQGLKADTGWIADAYYEQPSQALKVMAVTGTNGKTSCTWWLAQALNELNNAACPSRCAVVGTLGVGEPPHLQSTGMTTPDPVLLQGQFRNFVSSGVTHCAIEASSIGLAEQRLAGTRIQLALFTNFTQDHLDYHGSMAAYWQAKEALFAWPDLQVAVVNVDDAQGAQLAANLQSEKCLTLWTCSSQGKPARLQALNLQRTATGMAFDVKEADQVLHIQTHLMGDYNVDNLLGVMASLRALDISLDKVMEVCARLQAVPGRMEKVSGVEGIELPLTVVDYAHTPDAVAQTLATLKLISTALGSKLWCVLGCGGDRDASKRPLMAAAAESAADHVVLTSDNPRTESPAAIVQDMLKGLKIPSAAHQELDRAKAIAHVVMQAGVRDVILIAGKGHEDTQEIAGVKHAFDDRLHAHDALVQRANRQTLLGVQA